MPVTEINISSPGNVFTVTPGKSVKLSATTNKNASDKTVKWEFSDPDEKTVAQGLGIDTALFEKKGTVSMAKTASVSGTFEVKASARDGSGTYQTATINVKKGAVTALKVADEDDKDVTKANLGLYPQTTSGDFATEKAFKVKVISDGLTAGDFQDKVTVSSSNESVAKAEVDPLDPAKLYVYTYKAAEYRATKTGKATITVKTTDGSNKSAKFTVVVSEPVRNIYLSAEKSTRDIAANGKITMKAAVNSKASNKKIVWSLKDTHYDDLDSSVATISAKGTITPNKELSSQTEIYVLATAVDGSETTSAYEKITLYPAQGKITFYDETGKNPLGSAITMGVNEYTEVMIKGENAEAFADYLVTYKQGPIKVQYLSKTAAGTKIKITSLKKGSSTINAAARDGSGKKGSLKVTVNK